MLRNYSNVKYNLVLHHKFLQLLNVIIFGLLVHIRLQKSYDHTDIYVIVTYLKFSD